MVYTTVTAVTDMFPTFTRSGNKGPSDADIQGWIADAASDIDAILQRRFQEAYQTLGFAAWQATFTADQLNVLEHINRFGAAAELGQALATSGIAAAQRLADKFEGRYDEGLRKLNARDRNDKPLMQGGDFDFLFDAEAKVETPRPQMGGVSGGDQWPGEYDGTSNVFKKFDRREM